MPGLLPSADLRRIFSLAPSAKPSSTASTLLHLPIYKLPPPDPASLLFASEYICTVKKLRSGSGSGFPPSCFRTNTGAPCTAPSTTILSALSPAFKPFRGLYWQDSDRVDCTRIGRRLLTRG